MESDVVLLHIRDFFGGGIFCWWTTEGKEWTTEIRLDRVDDRKMWRETSRPVDSTVRRLARGSSAVCGSERRAGGRSREAQSPQASFDAPRVPRALFVRGIVCVRVCVSPPQLGCSAWRLGSAAQCGGSVRRLGSAVQLDGAVGGSVAPLSGAAARLGSKARRRGSAAQRRGSEAQRGSAA